MMTESVSVRDPIMLVDNEPLVRGVLADILRAYDYEVRIAPSGLEAVRLAKEESFSLVLLDVNMPGMNGWETLESLKAVQPGLPVLMMSGVAEVEMALERGADGFVSKPYRPAEILEQVADILRASNAVGLGEADAGNAAS